jgi:hypothetical protein
MKEWQTTKTINLLRVLNPNIQNPILGEIYIKNPALLENHGQIEKFLQPLEIDDFPCQPSTCIENSKDRRLRIPKVHQISFSCKWTKEPNKILTPSALQIFFNILNTYKLINESYQKEWEFDELFSKSKDQLWRIRETIILLNFN